MESIKSDVYESYLSNLRWINIIFLDVYTSYAAPSNKIRLNLSTEYYIINESISLNSDQWSILIGGIGVALTLIGFAFAFIIYKRQRFDTASDSFIFFQASLPTLKDAIENTIENLNEFHTSLLNTNDDFKTPILSSTLSDRFIGKLNIIDLNRFYFIKRKLDIEIFKNFIVSSNFIGDYLNYFITEVDFFRAHYKEKEQIYSDWQLLRSNKFFSSIYDRGESVHYKEFYAQWVKELSQDGEVFKMDENGNPQLVISRKLLVEKHIEKLRQNIFPFIAQSEKANEISLIANKIVMAYYDMDTFKTRMILMVAKDIQKFKDILIEINGLIE